MSDRLPSAASHAAYYEQHQHSTMTSALNKATMPFQAALQQRLQDYHQPNVAYESRYYPSGPTYAHHSHAYPYGSLHYPSGPAYLNHHHPHSHYDTMYNGRLIGGSGGGVGAGLMYGERSRYLPYQQQPNLRGMFTAAGHQLVPSRVLHYPPSSCNNAYQQQQPSHYQQKQQHHSSMYDLRNESPSQYQLPNQHQQQPQLQHYTHRSPYLQMQHHFGGEQNSVAYNPYIISQHHYQQSQSQMLMSSIRPTSASENEVLSSYQEPIQSSTKIRSTPSELSSTAAENNISNENNRDTRTHSYTKEDVDRLEGSSLVAVTSSSTDTQQPSIDCLTTSPPLISSSGTDSGISSCSTRARSDSTQSTPIYNNDYPMSVGSSSGISYHCADGKDFEEVSNKDKEDTTAHLPTKNSEDLDANQKCKSNESELIKNETKENEDVDQSQQQIDEQTNNECTKSDAKNEETIAEKVKHEFNLNINKSSIVPTPALTTTIDTNQKMIQQQRTECNSTMSASISASGSRTNSSPGMNELLQNASQKTQHQHQQLHQQQQLHQNLHEQQHQQILQQQPQQPQQQLRQQRIHQQLQQQPRLNTHLKYTANNRYSPSSQQSPPSVPAPPHNSPIGYSPFASTTISPPSYPTVSNKNRIIECDLIPSKKKSKRKSNNDVEAEVREEIRDITPLPGFQQTFGSTEIGRFSEAFLFTPASADSTADDFETFIKHERQQQQQQQQQHHQYQQQLHQSATSYYGSTAYTEGNYRNMHGAWPSASSSSAYEAFDYSSVSRGVPQLNQTFSGRPYNPLDMMFHERYASYGGSYRMNEGNFNEIRCNGY